MLRENAVKVAGEADGGICKNVSKQTLNAENDTGGGLNRRSLSESMNDKGN